MFKRKREVYVLEIAITYKADDGGIQEVENEFVFYSVEDATKAKEDFLQNSSFSSLYYFYQFKVPKESIVSLDISILTTKE